MHYFAQPAVEESHGRCFDFVQKSSVGRDGSVCNLDATFSSLAQERTSSRWRKRRQPIRVLTARKMERRLSFCRRRKIAGKSCGLACDRRQNVCIGLIERAH